MKLTWAVLSLVISSAVSADLTPVASRISVAPLPRDQADVAGAPGSVPPLSDVIVINLDTGHYDFVAADEAGRFRAQLFAPSGTTLLVKSDPSRMLVRRQLERTPLVDFHFNQLIAIPGTMIRLPDPAPVANEIPFGSPAIYRTGDRAGAGAAPVSLRGSISGSAFAAGATLTVRLDLRVAASASAPSPRVRVQLSLDPLTDAKGRGKLTQSTFASTVLTPTGLPIERKQWLYTAYQSGGEAALVEKDGALEASLSIALPIHRDLPPAYYRPALVLSFDNVGTTPLDGQRLITFLDTAARSGSSIFLPTIRVGDAKPPRIPLALLMNETEQAMRGVTALEDRDSFAISPRMALASERLVLPRTDPRTGAPRRYNLEPFAPTLAMGDRGGPPAPSRIPIRFPSGELRVAIRRPDGTTETLGPAVFAQSLFNGPGRNGNSMEGGPYITDAYRLTTGDSRFEVEFPLDGLYQIQLDASFDDIWGNRWSGGGSYEIQIARPLVIDPAHVFGTPFETGDVMNIGATLLPPIDGDLEVRLRFAPHSDATRLVDRTFRARANRFGYASAGLFAFDEPGEYRVDLFASGIDRSGARWAGARTWGGVVAPRDAHLIAHGKRGIDDQRENRQPWFFRTQTGLTFGRGHVHIPFHSGDVMWMNNADAATPTVSFQASGDILALLPRYCCAGNLTELARLGELPFFSANFDKPLDVHLSAGEPDLTGYAYRSVQRPLIRVREFIAEDANSYWRFNDLYGRQLGTGIEGDLPNDFKFQFAGAVVRGTRIREPLYGIYGSLFALVADDDPGGGTRIFPPFQGNGGGPSGGPLFTLKGKPIDIFFHPTGIRPGGVLVTGNTASFSGQIGPTLPSKAEITVTSPTGKVRVVSGQANKVGYFYDPSTDFRVDEPGVWRVRVKVWHDGLTSAGQVTPPFPTGDVLGSRQGEFYFYVVRPDALQLEIGPMQQFVRPADGPIAFTVAPPSGLTNLAMYYTTTMPGFILEEGATSTLTYTYDAQKLARDFPNLDLHDGDGLAGVDTITISFLVTGLDPTGRRQYLARQIVLQGEELQMPEQKPIPRQRGARR